MAAPELLAFRTQFSEAYKSQDTVASSRIKAEEKEFQSRIGYSPVKVAAMLPMMPIYFCFFWALRKIIYTPETFNIASAPFLWMASPFTQDPFFVIPALTACVTYLSLRNMMKKNPTNNSTNFIIRKGRVFAPLFPLASFFLFASFPAAFNAYILTLSVMNLSLTTFFTSQTFFNLAGLPKAYPGTSLYHELIRKGEIVPETVRISTPETPAANKIEAKAAAEVKSDAHVEQPSLDPTKLVGKKVLEQAPIEGHMSVHNTKVFNSPGKKSHGKKPKATK